VSSSDSWNLLVFRDGRRVLNGPELLGTLRENLNALYSISDFSLLSTRERLTEALLRSGELECSLADHEGCHRAADILARTTDQLAIALSGQLKLPSPILDNINALDVPELLAVPIPEGFCYYALHPLDYIDLLNENPLSAPAAAVVGIRSIGATLSAVVRAWFELRGIPADRITVRPSGHPFDRSGSSWRATRPHSPAAKLTTQIVIAAGAESGYALDSLQNHCAEAHAAHPNRRC